MCKIRSVASIALNARRTNLQYMALGNVFPTKLVDHVIEEALLKMLNSAPRPTKLG